MKIVCDACQAKYSISDDKVQGKVFKIRCKKCSNIIVVRGGAGAGAAEPAAPPPQEKDTRVYDYGYEGGDHAPAGDDSVWHVVINQDQVGPMTAVEVQKKFKSGEIDAETYVWREGFADWLPLAQVDTFASLAATGAAASPRSPEPVSSMFSDDAGLGAGAGIGRNDPGDLFAAAGAGESRDDDSGDLFGGKPSAGANAAKLRGERNENSVLFSLNNLAQLASDKPQPAAKARTTASAAAAAPAAAAPSTGGSGGEGSGLIDIRSMANAYLGGPGSAAKPATAGIGSIDDLPVFGGGGFSEPAVIVPMASRTNSNKLMFVLIGSVGLLAVAAVIVVVVLLKGGDKQAAVATAPATPAATDTVAATAPTTPTPPPATPPSEPKQPEPAASTPPPPSDTRPSEPATPPPPTRVAASDPPERRPAARPTPAAATKQPKPTPAAKEPAAKEPVAAKSGGGGESCDEVSCVLNNYEGACCAKYKKGGSKPSGGGGGGAAKSDLPDTLDRAMITDGVGKVKARVMTCGDKSPAKGQVKVSIKVGPDGAVTSVQVKTTPDAALGNCVAGIVQKATFGRTVTGGSFSYLYTF